MSFERIAKKMIDRGLSAVDPARLIRDRLSLEGDWLTMDGQHLHLTDFKRIFVIGLGKGAARMAQAMEEKLGDRIATGAVVVKYGHTAKLKKIAQYEAGHPVPDENTLKATQAILDLVKDLKSDDLVFVLITGGGSALFEALPEGVSLHDLKKFNALMLECGAAIDEINILRKHLSLVKGGRLAARLQPATVVSLILSDVVGDPLESIASGPTTPDDTTFEQAWQVVKKYGIESQLPEPVRAILQRGLSGQEAETPKPGQPFFDRVRNIVLGNNRRALFQMAHAAQEAGLRTLVLTDRLQGEAREVAKLIAAVAESALRDGFPLESPGCILLGGEPTVTLRGNGKGGRNQEMALAVLGALGRQQRPFYFCSLGSDGTDGPTDAAGAWIDEHTLDKADRLKLNWADFLRRNDSYHFFKALDQLIVTGPTGTNVMDLIFFLF